VSQFFHCDHASVELDLLSGAAGRSEEAEVLCGEFSFLQKLKNDSPYGTGRANDGHSVKHGIILSKRKDSSWERWKKSVNRRW
jgi:hypothetical protein